MVLNIFFKKVEFILDCSDRHASWIIYFMLSEFARTPCSVQTTKRKRATLCLYCCEYIFSIAEPTSSITQHQFVSLLLFVALENVKRGPVYPAYKNCSNGNLVAVILLTLNDVIVGKLSCLVAEHCRSVFFCYFGFFKKRQHPTRVTPFLVWEVSVISKIYQNRFMYYS